MLPSFIVAGIMKSGTTYLDNLIRNHPEILMPERSMELSFFDNDEIWSKGVEWFEGAFSQFKGKKGIVGQTSADCAFNPGSIERIKNTIPNAKLIFVVRHPCDRLYSLYWHQVSMGREALTFEQVIEQESRRVKRSYHDFKMYSYLARSKYAEQFKNVYRFFDEKNVLIIPFELLVKYELEMLNEVFSFLGVTPINTIEIVKNAPTKRNKARIPQNRTAIRIAYVIQRLGFVGVSRNLLNRFREEQEPPRMNPETRKALEEILKVDIDFHKEVISKYAHLIN